LQSQSRILDDIARVAGGALGALSGLKQEIEQLVRQRVEKFLADRDLITREEFEVVKAVAAQARTEQEKLDARVAKLESKLAKKGKSKNRVLRSKGKRSASPVSGSGEKTPRHKK